MPQQFSISVKQFADKVKGRENVFLQRLMLEIGSGVVHMTPVDTGRARGNWNVGINNVDLTDREPETTAQAVIERAKQIIRRVTAGDVIYISNNVEYIVPLEEGHSQDQAPSGMVALTLQRIRQIQGEAIRHAKEVHP